MNNQDKSILYVNFAPYMNAGNVQDYFLEHFSLVVVFCFNFHHLGKGQDPSMVTVYRNKRIVSQFPLYQNPTPAQFVFFLLPLRSIIIFIQLFIHTFLLKQQYGTFNYFFSVNAFTAWCGNLIRFFGMTNKTLFWVWDYYPPKHSDPMIRFMRWLYWQFDKPATTSTDRVVFLNTRLAELRKENQIIPREEKITSIGIGTNPRNNPKKIMSNNLVLVFFGVVRRRHGLDLLLDATEELGSKFPKCTLSIIGGGPDLNYYRNISKNSPIKIHFHGFIKNDVDIDKLIQKADIGIATYTNDESNISQYTDPSKIKRYLSNGIPIIATDVFEFSTIIRKEKAGIIIPYNRNAVVKAVDEIKNKYKLYQNAAIKLADKYRYQSLYNKFFE